MSTGMTNRNPNLDPLTLPLNGSTLIEASAGTGKTFTSPSCMYGWYWAMARTTTVRWPRACCRPTCWW